MASRHHKPRARPTSRTASIDSARVPISSLFTTSGYLGSCSVPYQSILMIAHEPANELVLARDDSPTLSVLTIAPGICGLPVRGPCTQQR